jgi:carbon-monoxide dehydrogenase iron sulfur subunit
MWTLSIDREKCNGCGVCQVMCSLAKKKAVQPAESRIRVNRYSGADFQSLALCQHCAEPGCVNACLMGVVIQDPGSGLVGRDTAKCFACGACKVMCPAGAPVYDSHEDAYVTCDLCKGEPICVKVCPQNALSYLDLAAASEEIRYKQGLRFFRGRQEVW